MQEDGRRLAYLPDHAPAAGVSAALLDALQGVDVLVHDAQFLEAERDRADAYGHATVADAVRLAERVGAGRSCSSTTARTARDDDLDAVAGLVPTGVEVLTAREGLAFLV